MTPAQSTISFLNDVSRRLYMFGWIQRDFCRYEACCLAGAMACTSIVNTGDYNAAYHALRHVILKAYGFHLLSTFNDAPGRTQSEIFQALRYARRLIKARERK